MSDKRRGRPAGGGWSWPPVTVPASASVQRAVAIVLATVADARAEADIARLPGRVGALRGGSYVLTEDGVRFEAARVVTDAVAYGTQEIGRRATRTRLRLRGRGVRPAQLTLRSNTTITRITETVAGRPVALRVASTHESTLTAAVWAPASSTPSSCGARHATTRRRGADVLRAAPRRRRKPGSETDNSRTYLALLLR